MEVDAPSHAVGRQLNYVGDVKRMKKFSLFRLSRVQSLPHTPFVFNAGSMHRITSDRSQRCTLINSHLASCFGIDKNILNSKSYIFIKTSCLSKRRVCGHEIIYFGHKEETPQHLPKSSMDEEYLSDVPIPVLGKEETRFH